MPRKTTPFSERFWNKVSIKGEDDCWEWTAGISTNGYGKIGIKTGKVQHTLIASRASWELSFGKIKGGLHVCHKCDNPKCVNPKHLFLGTAKDNIQDMIKKGRRKGYDMSGKNNPNYGKHWSEEFKESMKKKYSKRFQITNPEGKIILGCNIRDFCKTNNINQGQLSMLKRGIVKTCKGFTNFKLLD